MEITPTGRSEPLSQPLKSWVVATRKIGDRDYSGRCVVAQAMHVTYQQQSTTFGRTAGVFGLSRDGDGFVTGGGGFVDTVHRGVVTIVFRDEAGAEQAYELPASLAARETSVARLDIVNQTVVGATNLSGRGSLIQLADATAFVNMPSVGKIDIALSLAAILVFSHASSSWSPSAFGWAMLLATAPAIKVIRIVRAHRDRRDVNRYIAHVCS